jgi:hypothetical protein
MFPSFLLFQFYLRQNFTPIRSVEFTKKVTRAYCLLAVSLPEWVAAPSYWVPQLLGLLLLFPLGKTKIITK